MMAVLCLPGAAARRWTPTNAVEMAVDWMPSRGRMLQTTVSTNETLYAAVADSSVAHILIESGHYMLLTSTNPGGLGQASLYVNRSLVLEAVEPGSVVLDANASSSSQRGVLVINLAPSDTVELIGLNITGGLLLASNVVCDADRPTGQCTSRAGLHRRGPRPAFHVH